jgi:mitochondrial chaperone BCS1
LDGVVAAEERMVFMTTNHIENLDPALTRPGRVDSKVYMGNVTENQAKDLFLKFYETENENAAQFVKMLNSLNLIGTISPATLQAHFVLHRNSAAEALNSIDRLIMVNTS